MRKLLTKQNVILYGGYAAFFGVCFMLFAYFTFPYDRVKGVLEQRGSQGAPGVDTKLRIGELGPSFLTGVALHDVVYERKGATDTEAAKINVDDISLRVSPLSLFTGLRLNFGADVGGGEIDGQYSGGNEGSTTHLAARVSDAVDLAKLGLGAFVGIPIKGTANGEIDVTLEPVPVDSHGAISLTVDKLTLADSKTSVKVPGMGGGLTLPALDAGTLELRVSIKDGVATIERMESKGKDLEISGSGSIRLANPVSQSRADVLLSKISDAYKQQSDKTKMMFELVDQNPVTSAAKTSDGSLRFRLTGTLAALRPVPGGAAGPAGRAGRAARKKVPGPD